MKRIFGRVTLVLMMMLILCVNVYASDESYLQDLGLSDSVQNDLEVIQSELGTCEVDVIIQPVDASIGSVVFSQEAGDSSKGSITATASEKYMFTGFRYFVVASEGYGLAENGEAVDAFRVAIDYTEGSSTLNLSLVNDREGEVEADRTPEFTVYVVADFESLYCEVMISPEVLLIEGPIVEGSVIFPEESAGKVLVRNVLKEAKIDLVKSDEDTSYGKQFIKNLKIDSGLEFEAIPNEGYKFVAWQGTSVSTYEPISPINNPLKDVVRIEGYYEAKAVFSKVIIEPITESYEVTGSADHASVTIDGLTSYEEGKDALVEILVGNDRTIETVRAFYWDEYKWVLDEKFNDLTSIELNDIQTNWNVEVTSKAVIIDEPDPKRPTPKTTLYVLTVNVIGEGSVPGFQGVHTFSSGTNIKLEAVLNNDSDQKFQGWTGDMTSSSAVDQLLLNKDMTVTATFDGVIEEVIIPEKPDEEILEEVIPETVEIDDIVEEALPQTGGIPIAASGVFGLLVIGAGWVLKRQE